MEKNEYKCTYRFIYYTTGGAKYFSAYTDCYPESSEKLKELLIKDFVKNTSEYLKVFNERYEDVYLLKNKVESFKLEIER